MDGVRHLTTEEFAARVRRSPRTVEDWRTDRRGPAYVQPVGPGTPVLYREPDVEAWEESRLVRPGVP